MGFVYAGAFCQLYHRFCQLYRGLRKRASVSPGIHKAHVSDAHVGFLVAERTRFELVIRVFAYDGLANRWFQPLTHLSGTLFRREIVPIRLD